MKENKYDDRVFFEKYSGMERSVKGLAGAGEWNALEKLLPDFEGKRVLDLGCGFGWHCEYAVEHGAATVTGVDISRNMLERAGRGRNADKITYLCCPIEDVSFGEGSFDVVISSLAFHYVEDFDGVCKKIQNFLIPGGDFVFSAEHPVFTAYGSQDWIYGENGEILYFPVDRYFYEGKRRANFLGEEVIKYHRTLTTYLNTLLENGFELTHVVEPQPPENMPGMEDELRRPMMVLISCKKR